MSKIQLNSAVTKKQTVADLLSNLFIATLLFNKVHKIEFGMSAWNEFVSEVKKLSEIYFKSKNEKINISNIKTFWNIPIYPNDSIQTNSIEFYTENVIHIFEL